MVEVEGHEGLRRVQGDAQVVSRQQRRSCAIQAWREGRSTVLRGIH